MAGAHGYNRLATIERLTDTPDGQGGFTRAWASIGATYCKATPTGGAAALVAGTLQQQQPWRIEMPWRANVNAQDRITASWLPAGFAIGIDSVNDQEGRGKSLVILGTASKI